MMYFMLNECMTEREWYMRIFTRMHSVNDFIKFHREIQTSFLLNLTTFSFQKKSNYKYDSITKNRHSFIFSYMINSYSWRPMKKYIPRRQAGVY